MLVIGGHVDVVGITGAVRLPADPALVTGLQVSRHVPTLDMVVDVRGLGGKAAYKALPPPWPDVGHLAANGRVGGI
jgi:hypothetical protein